MFLRILNIAALVFLGVWILPLFFVTRVEPWEIGVRQSIFGGISEEDFGLGYHWAVTGIHRFHRLPRGERYLDFSSEPGADSKSLEVRTKENNVIFVDVSVAWRIKPGHAFRIIREGLYYEDKVRSTATSVLLERLAAMSNSDVQQPDEREKMERDLLPVLNEALDRYHIVADHVLLRMISFRKEYEDKLQNKQFYAVQGRLDEARRQESVAVQETDTIEKNIQRDINLKREEWNAKIEKLKTQYEIEIATLEAEALRYDRQRRSEGDALYSRATAEGDLAEAKAEALGERLKSAALATRAGRTYSAMQAAENFELGDIELNSLDPSFLSRFGSMKAWRSFFLGE